jgi:predicted transposase YdaD
VSKPYDATSKELLQSDPAGWAAFLGVVRPPEQVKLIDSDLSTVTAATDKVLRIEDARPWILDVEFQSWRDPSAPRQLLKYNALLHEKHKVPVASVLVVLAEDANSPAYSGRHPIAAPFGPDWEFRYTVVRVWEAAAEPLLTGPLSLVPLAPVANVTAADYPEVLRRAEARVTREADPATGGRLLTAVSILLQMRYGIVAAEEFLRRFPEVREYGGFRTCIEEGRQEGLRDAILRQGRKKFGPPTVEIEASVDAITDLARLGTLAERLLDVNTWDELLKDA